MPRRRPRVSISPAPSDTNASLLTLSAIGRHLHQRSERRPGIDTRSDARRGLDDAHDPHRPHRRLAGSRDETGSLTDAAERTRPQGPEDRWHRRRRAGARRCSASVSWGREPTALPPLSVGPSVSGGPTGVTGVPSTGTERQRVSLAERRTRPEPDLLGPRSVLDAAAVPGRPEGPPAAPGPAPTGGPAAAPAPDRRAPAPDRRDDRSRTDRADPAADERFVDDHRRS